MSDLKELLTELDFEQWLDMEGIIYRRGGVSTRGREVNIKVSGMRQLKLEGLFQPDQWRRQMLCW